MTSRPSSSNNHYLWRTFIEPIVVVVLVGALFIGLLILIWLSQQFNGLPALNIVQSLFATNTVQAWWYVTRAAGLTAYFLLWLSMAYGLAIPSRIIQPVLNGTYTFDFHEYLSLLGLGFVVLHVIVLLFDKYLPFNLIQILIPFTDTYRPLWVGLGIIGFYLFLLVTITFYIRQWIGTQAFRTIHLFSLIGYIGVTVHGLFAGTDSALPVTKWLYAGTFLIVVFLAAHWLVMQTLAKREKQAEQIHLALKKQEARISNTKQRKSR